MLLSQKQRHTSVSTHSPRSTEPLPQPGTCQLLQSREVSLCRGQSGETQLTGVTAHGRRSSTLAPLRTAGSWVALPWDPRWDPEGLQLDEDRGTGEPEHRLFLPRSPVMC